MIAPDFSAIGWFRDRRGAVIDIDEVLRWHFYDDPEVTSELRLANRRGMKMSRDRYRVVATVIVCVLLDRDRIFLDELLEDAQAMLASRAEGDIAYNLLLVKNDLESRKIVRVVRGIGAERRQILFFRSKSIINVLRRGLASEFLPR